MLPGEAFAKRRACAPRYLLVRRFGSPVFHNAIVGAFDTLPKAVRERLDHVDFLCGVDPATTGGAFAISHIATIYTLKSICPSQTNDDRPADRVPGRTSGRSGTSSGTPCTKSWVGLVRSKPITEYARTNAYEAFAEAFCAWREPGYCGRNLHCEDPRADALFTMVS
jgi:hypothetical protein